MYGRATGYSPLPAGFFGEARVELGGVLAKNGVVAPDSQRFRAGGDDSVRGYGYRTLAPTTPDGGVTGGKLLFTASLLFIEQRLERLTDGVADTNSLAGWSLFQTLGFDSPNRNAMLRHGATALVVILVIGFGSVPVLFFTDVLAPPNTEAVVTALSGVSA